MADSVDYEQKYSDTQKKMWEWQQKYLDSILRQKRREKTAVLVAVTAGVVGAAAGYVAGVLRVGR